MISSTGLPKALSHRLLSAAIIDWQFDYIKQPGNNAGSHSSKVAFQPLFPARQKNVQKNLKFLPKVSNKCCEVFNAIKAELLTVLNIKP